MCKFEETNLLFCFLFLLVSETLTRCIKERDLGSSHFWNSHTSGPLGGYLRNKHSLFLLTAQEPTRTHSGDNSDSQQAMTKVYWILKFQIRTIIWIQPILITLSYKWQNWRVDVYQAYTVYSYRRQEERFKGDQREKCILKSGIWQVYKEIKKKNLAPHLVHSPLPKHCLLRLLFHLILSYPHTPHLFF